MNASDDTVTMDRRVTRAFEWLSGIFASLLVIVLVWVGSTLVDMRRDLAVLHIQQAPIVVRIDRLDTRIDNLQDRTNRIESRVGSIDARQMRGINQ